MEPTSKRVRVDGHYANPDLTNTALLVCLEHWMTPDVGWTSNILMDKEKLKRNVIEDRVEEFQHCHPQTSSPSSSSQEVASETSSVDPEQQFTSVEHFFDVQYRSELIDRFRKCFTERRLGINEQVSEFAIEFKVDQLSFK